MIFAISTKLGIIVLLINIVRFSYKLIHLEKIRNLFRKTFDSKVFFRINMFRRNVTMAVFKNQAIPETVPMATSVYVLVENFYTLS